jgi:hypothetical protein|tara:strand:+ start:2016 stop:4910 length:2895 start_codon:yes stop_codon:yes gene_type:complete
MKAKQIGLTQYNDAILSIYGANPVATLKEAKGATTTAPDLTKDNVKKKSQPKSGTLVKETLRLRNTAVLNLKLAKNIQKYEKERLSKLSALLDKDKSSKGGEGGEVEEDTDDPKKLERKSPWWRKFLRKFRNFAKGLLKKLFKKFVPRRVRARGRLLARRIRRFKRVVKANIKRRWRNFTKPFRQAQRFIANTTAPLRRRLGTGFKRAQRNLTKPFRQAKRFAETAVKNPRKALQQTQRALNTAKNVAAGAATRVNQFVSPGIKAGREFAGQKLTQGRKALEGGIDTARSIWNFGTEMLQQASGKKPNLSGGNRFGFLNRFSGIGQKLNQGRQALMGGIDIAVKKGQQIGEAVAATWTKWSNVVKDPKTWNKIKDSVVGGYEKLKGAAKKLYDDFITWLAGTKWFREMIESKIGKKVTRMLIEKGGKIALKKILTRLVIGLGTVMALWEAVDDWARGDYEGAALAALGAIPVVGLVAVVVDILRDLFPKTWESVVSQITGQDAETRSKNIKDATDDLMMNPVDSTTGGNDIADGIPMAADGMVTDNQPQLVIVGDGGEEEFIVPKSKLAQFLGSDTALEFLNFGGSQVVSTVNEYLKKLGIAGETAGQISELKDAQDLPKKPTNNVKNVRPFGSAISDISGKIMKFIIESVESLIEPLKNIMDWLKKNVLDNPLVKGITGVVGAIGSSIFGGGANAATLNNNFNLSNMSADGVFNTELKTGKSAYIGGSADYHIDSQFKSSLPMSEKVAMMDQLAAGYAAQGRIIEFSNAGVVNQVYDPSASLEEKSALLQRAFEAHQLPRGRAIDAGGFNRIDYYAPLVEDSRETGGQGRFRDSVVGQDILIPTRGGEKVSYHQGGDYGAFVHLTDKDGNVIFRTGHGDTRTAKSGTVDISALNKDDAVDEDPNNLEDDNIMVQMLQQQLAQQANAQTQPNILPMPIPLGSVPAFMLPRTNTPAWGHAAVHGN